MSCVATVDRYEKAEVLKNFEGDLITPSVVFFETATSKVVGKEAKNTAAVHIDLVVETVKNFMGKTMTWEFHGEEYTPEKISAIILRRLKEDAEQALGQSIDGAVITVPAIFGEVERKATRNAAEIAGLKVLSILEEPVAAAIAYGFGSADGKSRNGTMLIYDLGGGTFDITILTIKDGVFQMLATDGDRSLGGKDWDKAIIDYVAKEFEQEFGSDPRDDPFSLQDLINDAEVAKKSLSLRDSVPIRCRHNGKTKALTLTRTAFEDLTRRRLEQTQTTIQLVLERLKDENKLPGGWDSIDKVLLVGGSSRMPQVTQMLRKLSGKEPEMLEVDLVVAQGAALYSVMKVVETAEKTGDRSTLDKLMLPEGFEEVMERAEVHRVCSFALGIRVLGDYNGYSNAIMVPMNSDLPFIGTSSFGTAQYDQREAAIFLLEGEDPNPQFCEILGKGHITNLPPGLPAGATIEVTIGLTDESAVSVHAVELTSGRDCQFDVERSVDMSAAEIAQSQQRLARDKVS